MGYYKTCSINKVIGKIYRDYKPSNSGWVDDAIEWVGEAISIMKVSQGYKEQFIKIKIVDRRGKLPCNAENILGFEYNNKRLPRSGGINHKNSNNSGFNNLVLAVDESYSLNPNYIITTFEKGYVTCYFEGIELDCDGFPMIIDNAIYHNALSWYVLRGMCLRGFKHQTVDFQLCDKMWEKYYPQAQNEFRMTDIDDYEVFKTMWVGAVRPTNLVNKFFNTIVNPTQTAQNNTYLPGNLVETFSPIIRDDETGIIDEVN